MLQHAQSELPNECCGLLAGVCGADVARAEKHYPLVNEAASPIEYRSEPRSMLQADRDIRKENLSIVAVYHSHPTSAPIPSRTDLERNYMPDVMQFIISLNGAEPSVRAWWLVDDHFDESQWQIIDS